MKRYIFLILCPSLALSMDKQVYNKKNPLFNQLESKCWLWFDQNQKIKTDTFKGLPLKTQNIILKVENGDLADAYNQWADKFLFVVRVSGITIPENYNVALIATVQLKMSEAIRNKSIEEPTDRPTARIFAYSQLLNQDERTKIRPENYKANAVEGEAVLGKLAGLVVAEYVKLGEVKDELEARKKEEKAFLDHKRLDYQLFS